MGAEEDGFQSTLGAYDDVDPAAGGGTEASADEGANGADSSGETGTSDEADSSEPFQVAVKESASDRNPEVAKWVEAAGRLFTYDTRSAAEEHAAGLSDQGGAPVAVQAAAPNDDSPADAYLVAGADRNRSEPADPSEDAWDFDVAANQYGALGEALLTTPRTNPPALTYFVEGHRDIDEEIQVRIESGDPVNAAIADPGSAQLTEQTWIPDCVAVARRAATGAVLGRYLCEIKTGDASFQRHQTAVMEATAAEPGVTVLKVRVRIDSLPDSYHVRFETVSPDSDAAVVDAGADREDGDDAEDVVVRGDDAEIL